MHHQLLGGIVAIYVVFLTIANGLIGGLVEDVEISERAVGASVSMGVIV